MVRLFGGGWRLADSDGPWPWRKMVAGLGQDSTEKTLKRKSKEEEGRGNGVVERRKGGK